MEVLFFVERRNGLLTCRVRDDEVLLCVVPPDLRYWSEFRGACKPLVELVAEKEEKKRYETERSANREQLTLTSILFG